MKRFFYFLSKTDTSIIKYCPKSVKNTQLSLGLFVLLTGIVAFIAGTYAISNVFIIESPLNGKPMMPADKEIFPILLGLIYAIFIMAIDREIVSTTNKIAALLRIPLAVIISLVISLPIELKLFDSRISKKLIIEQQNENDNLFTSLNKNVDSLSINIKQLGHKVLYAEKERLKWAEIMDQEIVGQTSKGRTGRAGKGPVYKDAEKNKYYHEKQINQFETEIADLEKTKQDQERKIEKRFETERIQQSFDLLSKYQILNKIIDEDKRGSAKKISWGITILFLLLELTPTLMKLLISDSEYDHLLEKRRRLNILSTRVIFNQAYDAYDLKSPEEIKAENTSRVNVMLQSQAN